MTTDVIDTSELSKDEEIDVLFHTNTLSKVATAVSPDCLYVYALHGKSRHVALWNLDQLIKSNQNLMELGEERMNDGRSYLLPEGGVRAGLNGLAIALQKIQQ